MQTPFIPYYRITPVTGTDKGKGLVFNETTGAPELQTLSTAGHTHTNFSDLNTITGVKITEWDAAYTASHGVNDPNSSHYLKAESWSRSELDGTCPVLNGAIDVSWIKNLAITGAWNAPNTNDRTIVGAGKVGIGLSLVSTVPSEKLHVNGAILLEENTPTSTIGRIYRSSTGILYNTVRLDALKDLNNTTYFHNLPTTGNSVSDIRSFTLYNKQFLSKCVTTVGAVNAQWGFLSLDPRAGETILRENISFTNSAGITTLLTFTANETGWKFYPTKVIIETTSATVGSSPSIQIYSSSGVTNKNIIYASTVTFTGQNQFLTVDLSGEVQECLTEAGFNSLNLEVLSTSGAAVNMAATVIGFGRRV